MKGWSVPLGLLKPSQQHSCCCPPFTAGETDLGAQGPVQGHTVSKVGSWGPNPALCSGPPSLSRSSHGLPRTLSRSCNGGDMQSGS